MNDYTPTPTPRLSTSLQADEDALLVYAGELHKLRKEIKALRKIYAQVVESDYQQSALFPENSLLFSRSCGASPYDFPQIYGRKRRHKK